MTSEPIFVLRGRNNETLHELRRTGDVSILANWVFWNLWGRRVFPYNTIEEGQTLYFVDLDARMISAELRVIGIGRVHYHDRDEPYRLLDRVFGIGSELAETAIQRRDLPVPGYLLAVAVDPVAYLGEAIDLDWSKVGGRAGWAAWQTVLGSNHTPDAARAVLHSLPSEGRPVPVHSHPIDIGAVETLADLPRAPRAPSAAVARAISLRAGGTCEVGVCDERARHLDHIYPWAHGGNSDAVNLQWLCARHNLTKSDRIPEIYIPDQLWIRYVTELDDESIRIGSELVGHEIRTLNSIYDLVIDEDVFLLWKRGGREVLVESFHDIDSLLVPFMGGRRIEIEGSPELDGPMFASSLIVGVTNADPVIALARLGRRPGDTVPLIRVS